MKKIILSAFLLMLSFSFSYADLEDTSILDKLKENEVKTLDLDFNLQTFESCENMENVMGNYIKTYWENNKKNYYRGPVMYDTINSSLLMGMDDEMDIEESAVEDKVSSNGNSSDFSETNTQVQGVDESDIIKTDGKYIYYYNSTDKYAYITDVKNKKVVKKIKTPKNFYNPVLYLDDSRLTIVSSGYTNYNYKSSYWINRNSKTFTIVYDIKNPEKPNLIKLNITDGDLRKSRKIGDYVYIITNNNFSIPYYSFKEASDIDFSLDKVMPKSIDISKTSDESKQNLTLKGKKTPFNIKSGNVAKCNEIEYVLPDEETLKEFDFSPSYNVISAININNVEEEVETKVIAGDISEIYMSKNSLYLTSHMYQTSNFSCPVNARCFVPWFPRGTNTLVHKIDIDEDEMDYKTSNIIPGSPLNQYSMDEYKGNFRIITSVNNWTGEDREMYTNLYVLDENLDLHGKLEEIQPGEEFKSSRYIGDMLYLVTFERTDPLFAISMKDSKNPKILGELKIPGYSTYLHPYDENHLIGIGYDTKENEWGGIINNGVKVDLYEINFDKKCGDLGLSVDEIKKCDSGDYKGIIVKQKYTKTFGERGSNSEALRNPRMFMWKSLENKLYLPIELRVNDKIDTYRTIDFFQGLISLDIDKNKGITEDFRVTHIDTKDIETQRKKDCEKYVTKENKCVKLLSGEEYCENTTRYVPKYCYAESPIGEYLASKSWTFRESYINRALWIGDEIFGISNSKIGSYNEKGKENYEINLK